MLGPGVESAQSLPMGSYCQSGLTVSVSLVSPM